MGIDFNRSTPGRPGAAIAAPVRGASRWDAPALLGMLRRRWWLVLGIAVLAGIAALAVARQMTPLYSAASLVKLDLSKRVLQTSNDAASQIPDEATVQTEVGSIHSRDIAGMVADQLGLAHDPTFELPKTADGRGADRREVVIDKLLQEFTVARKPQTYLVSLEYRDPDPERAAAIANSFADAYLRSSVDRRVGTASRQAETLDQNLSTLSAQVQAADAEVARYRAQAGISEGSSSGTITDQQVAPLSSQLATAEATAAAARAKVEAARAQIARGGLDAVSSVLDSSVITNLRSQRADVLRQQAEIEARYGPKHPDYVRITQQLAQVDRQLDQEAHRIVSGLQADADASDAAAASLRGQLARLKGEQASDTRAAVTADSLQRQADAKRAVYNRLAEAAQQTSEEGRSAEPQGFVVQRAIVPDRPVSPNKPLFLFIGLLAGGLIGVALALLLEILATGIRSAGEIEELGIPYLASVPELSARQAQAADGSGRTLADYVVAKPMSPLAETFRTVRNALRPVGRNEPQAIAIVSAVSGEGKTSTSIALGRVMALSGDRVVLVDCDVRLGTVARHIPAPSGAGLLAVLEGSARLDQALVRDEATGMDLLPTAGAALSPRDLVSSEAMRRLIADLKTRYDVVLLDTPPVLAVADARRVAALADAVMMVVRWEHTPIGAVRSTVSLLLQSGAALAGALLTRTDRRARPGGSDDPASYHSMYSQYQVA